MARPQSKKKQTQVARRPRRRGRWVPPSRLIAGRDFPEFLRQAVLLSGSLRQAARKLRVSYSTLRGWLGRRCEEPPEGERDLLAGHVAAIRTELDVAAEHLAIVRGQLDALERGDDG
ncbi:hypothetical protein [Haliangium ochraceum]|uniref:Uncharacterized protein n=1 Tax=Haliangium ochraceum (strain DSM 14365 / JCM 11303 / SMP-2) TaxID=502025 RepID=D0LPC1_HALO1|nr:hypothetical protein [Haliangium ochraceum]ACY13486.1 hypothetical protein Hoch_0872 [Haliangium ochraceum DSM 14365]